MSTASVYETWAPLYVQKGFWPRRVTPGTKACYDNGWQTPIAVLEETRGRNRTGAEYGLGLLMGSPFPDGTTLGALDVDRDEYADLSRVLLGSPVCGRIGKKGIVYFVRVRGVASNPEFRVQGESKHWGKVAECLFHKKLCLIPPTIHPDTGAPYRWEGTPLLEVEFSDLPIVEG